MGGERDDLHSANLLQLEVARRGDAIRQAFKSRHSVEEILDFYEQYKDHLLVRSYPDFPKCQAPRNTPMPSIGA